MDLIYAIILSNLFQAVALLGVGILFIYAASHVVRVRSRYVLPIVFAFAIMGIYSVDGTTSGPITMFIFTLLGVAMIRYKYPVSATVVGILLGRMLETQSILTHQISGGSFSYMSGTAGGHRPDGDHGAVTDLHGAVEAAAVAAGSGGECRGAVLRHARGCVRLDGVTEAKERCHGVHPAYCGREQGSRGDR